MKNNDEMYQSLLSRWDEYQEKKKKRLLMYRRIVPVLACLVLVVGIGIKYRNNMPPIDQQYDFTEETTAVTATAEHTIAAVNTTSVVTSTTKTVTTAVTVNNNSTAVTTAFLSEAITLDTSAKQTVTRTVPVTAITTAKHTSTRTSLAAEETTRIHTTTLSPIATAASSTTYSETSMNEPPISDPEDEYITDLLFGYDEGDMSVPIQQKPKSSVKLYMKCKSFCALGKTLSVDVALCDQNLHYDRFENTHIYEYSVYPSEDWKKTDDKRLIANGNKGGYSNEYAGENVQVFDVTNNIGNFSSYYHANTEISFSAYRAGSSGCITFSFLAKYFDGSGSLPENPSTVGTLHRMFFYVGQKGVGISSNDVEAAKAAYLAVCG